jgi:hypothetical protein
MVKDMLADNATDAQRTVIYGAASNKHQLARLYGLRRVICDRNEAGKLIIPPKKENDGGRREPTGRSRLR